MALAKAAICKVVVDASYSFIFSFFHSFINPLLIDYDV